MRTGNRKYIAGTLGLLTLSFLGCTQAENREEATQRPNVIFFITDDMTRDMFNCLEEGEGKNLSPHLDQLAKEGTLMMGQHVVSPVCTPSRFNCLTGMYASRATNEDFLAKMERSGGQTVVEWNSFITEGDTTVAHLLKAAGYRTGFVGKNHVIEVPGIYKPENYFADPADPEIRRQLRQNAVRFRKAFAKYGFDYAERIYDNNPNYIGLKKLAVHNLDWITEGGLEFIGENGDQPFFLYFATTTPHGPYEIDRSWGADRRITPYGILEEPVEILSDEETIRERLEASDVAIPPGRLASRGNVLWLDDALGALIDKLKATGQYEHTIIFFFSDHGQAAKGTVYQGGTESPSIIWQHGGFPCGTRNQTLVSNVDFAPTILDLAGVRYAAGRFDGKSFARVLAGDTTSLHESLYFELGYSRGVRKGDKKYLALRYPDYALDLTRQERMDILMAFNAHQQKQDKRVHHTDPTLPYSHLQLIPGGGDAEQASISKYPDYYDRDQLYLLSEDPREQENLFYEEEYRTLGREMQAELMEYVDELPGTFNNLGPVYTQHMETDK